MRSDYSPYNTQCITMLTLLFVYLQCKYCVTKVLYWNVKLAPPRVVLPANLNYSTREISQWLKIFPFIYFHNERGMHKINTKTSPGTEPFAKQHQEISSFVSRKTTTMFYILVDSLSWLIKAVTLSKYYALNEWFVSEKSGSQNLLKTISK